jgi:hypothetical protein
VDKQQFADPIVCRIVEFLTSIGVGVRVGSVPDVTVVPGIHIVRGDLVVDEARLAYPGDLLHEAGHVVVRTKDRWDSINGDVNGDPSEEMAAMAWSYAAAVHIGIDPAIVFHSAGYKGASEALLSSFTGPGTAIGVPMLQFFGMTALGAKALAADGADEKRTGEKDLLPFPSMLRWTR